MEQKYLEQRLLELVQETTDSKAYIDTARSTEYRLVIKSVSIPCWDVQYKLECLVNPEVKDKLITKKIKVFRCLDNLYDINIDY